MFIYRFVDSSVLSEHVGISYHLVDTLTILCMDDATACCTQVGNNSSWLTSDMNQEHMTHI